MRLRPPSARRRGASLVEQALVYPIAALLTLGVVIVAMGVYDYQQVAAMAREGARWASVHGGQYAQDTGNSMATPSTVYTNAIQPYAVGLDTTKLSYTVTWDDASEMPTFDDSNGNVVTNQVHVTVSYTWSPGGFAGLGGLTLQSQSVMAMQY
jgi:Flp pilus assembly protein TadG